MRMLTKTLVLFKSLRRCNKLDEHISEDKGDMYQSVLELDRLVAM